MDFVVFSCLTSLAFLRVVATLLGLFSVVGQSVSIADVFIVKVRKVIVDLMMC